MSNRTVLFLSILFALCCVSMSLVYGWMVTSDIEMFKVKMGDGTVASLFLYNDCRNIWIPCFCFHNDFYF